MKSKKKTLDDFNEPIPLEEYRIFTSQPEAVLQSYRIARICMFTVFPFFMVLSTFQYYISLIVAGIGGISLLMILWKKFGGKGAASPLIAALAGIAAGQLIISPALRHIQVIKEAFINGIG
ncbi:hypothetical protein FACS189498_3860 [Spirochaetia bacterium]|nr:hypothetical protein FACS189498_3860 [Spirochaetia bacterium]